MTLSEQSDYFERDRMTALIMLDGDTDYYDALDKAEREIMGKMDMEGFQVHNDY